jgi:hypothetical protein
MTIDSPPNPEREAASVVGKAMTAHFAGLTRPKGSELTAALLKLEQAAKQNRLVIPQASLLGSWRLCFSASKQAKYQSGQPVGSGFYIPKWAIARITFATSDASEAPLSIANELNMGPLQMRFTGPARYPGKKNLLAFDFTELTVKCLGARVYRGAVGSKKRAGQVFADVAIAQLPFFAFFAATEEFIAARGRGGGLAIWARVSEL